MDKKRCHEICFRDTQNDWDCALPVGNGRMGAMVFRQGNVLHIAVNQYDCYYHFLPGLHGKKKQGGQTFQDPARLTETYEELCRRADMVRSTGNVERSHYGRTLHPAQKTGRPSYRGACYPQGGELLLILAEEVETGHSCLKLEIEEAAVSFEAGSRDARVKARIWAARDKDGLVISLSQSRDGLWEKARMMLLPAVGMAPYRLEYAGGMQELCMRTIYGGNDLEPGFAQELALCFQGFCGAPGGADGCEPADGHGQRGGKEPDSRLLSGIGVLASAVLSLQPGYGNAELLSQELLRELAQAKEQHQAYWKQFWSAQIQLPDKFLERLWYLQLYLLECSSGRGSEYPEQACGLSGLWDIRRPNMWGSLWYWDVNIQSTFWGCGCAGHPELLKVFCDGYLAYEQDIRAYTRRVYGVEGWALDYPHTLYHCIQPWCAQFLWQYYQYSQDTGFLREKAYPVFMEQIAFFKRISEADEQGILHIRYDISPEQGPVTADSVITIACIRRLIRMAMDAGSILGRPGRELEELEQLDRRLPFYPLTADGSRYKDSLLAQDRLFLRHPSVLMPLFPAEEAGAGGENAKLWERTLQYAAEHTEIGTFGMGWLAAAAARLGKGRTALRLLYEKGLDYVLHANGLAYEESERFLNYCHLTKPAHYLPVMMEATGGVINAVNQMLMQTGTKGELRIFPAIPDGTPDLLESIVQYQEDDSELTGSCEDWQDVSFYGLLAPGGFRVSAERRNGRVTFLKVESSAETELKLMLPGEFTEDGSCHAAEYRMKPGEVLCWGCEDTEGASGGMKDETQEVLCHTAARTGRRIFLGGNRHTAYYQAVDAITCAYLLANEHRYTQTPCIFDFGTEEGEKDYEDSYPRQLAVSGQCVLYMAGPKRVGTQQYRSETGYGFWGADGVRAVDRGGPDDLRRDFLEGEQETVFMLSLPKGKYDLLLICGDEKQPSCTRITLPEHGTEVCTGSLEPGHFGCKILPLVHERDGELRICISTREGQRWKLNAMLVNKAYSLPG